MNKPKTSTAGVDAFRKRREALGMKEVRGAWAFIADHKAVKQFAASLIERRKTKGK